MNTLDEGKSVTEMVRLFNISTSSVKKWRKKLAEGSLEDPVRQCNFKKIDPIQLKAYILEHPDAYLSEIAEVFQCATSSIHEALTKLGFKHKKKHNLSRTGSKKS